MEQAEKLKQDAEAIRAMIAGEDMKPTDKRSKILERVRAILALADDEQTRNPAAADSYRAQADKLMTAYAIEEWQLEQAQAKAHAGQISKPEVRYYDITWWYTGNPEFHSDQWYMFQNVARHCRVVIAHRGQGKNGNYREIPLIGFVSDLDYFDMLFTHLMLQMGKQLEPKPDLDKSFGENAYTLRASGMARPRIAKLLYDLGIIPGVDVPGYLDADGEKISYERLAPNKEKSLRARVRVAGEKWGAEQGFDPTTTVNPKVWQRSFSDGFVSGVVSKLNEMRQMQKEEPGTGESNALALRDIYQVSLDLYKEMWPPPPPPKPVESTEVVKSTGRMPKLPAPPKTSQKAFAAGREAGRKAEISLHPSRGVGNNPKRLPS